MPKTRAKTSVRPSGGRQDLKRRPSKPDKTLPTLRDRQANTPVIAEGETGPVDSVANADRLSRLLVEEMNEGAALLTHEGVFLYLNKGLAGLLRCPFAQILGRPIYEFLPLDERPRVAQLLCRPPAETCYGENVFLAGDGTAVPVRLSIKSLLLDGQPCISVLVTSIRDREQAKAAVGSLKAILEERVERRTTELEAANQELQAFSYSVSHDLRTPLQGILGFARLLRDEYGSQLPPAAQRYVELIHANTLELDKMVQSLLTFSRYTRLPVKKQTVDPAELARQVVDEMSAEREGRRVEISIAEMPPCRADPVLLKQVYRNLLSNALKFTRGRDVARIEIGYQPPDGTEPGLYYVKDNGVGFDMQNADRLFGVFQRLHREEDYEGAGVGLAIVERIVHRHGGRVSAQARVDEGATLFFSV